MNVNIYKTKLFDKMKNLQKIKLLKKEKQNRGTQFGTFFFFFEIIKR